VLQELGRFLKADGAYKGSRSLRYDNLFDSYPSNLASIARFHSKRVLKLKEAVLTSYRRNEVTYSCYPVENNFNIHPIFHLSFTIMC
jgi:hypothetical protein